MNAAKIITILVANIILLAIAALGIAGLIEWVHMDKGLAITALIAPCIGAAGNIYLEKHIFEDSEAVTNLKREHFDAELSARRASEEREAQLVARERTAAAQQHHRDQQTIVALQQQVAQITEDRDQGSISHLNDKKKWIAETQRLNQHVHTLQKIIKPDPPGPASGSAPPWKPN